MRIPSCESRGGSWDGESWLNSAASGAGACWHWRGRERGQVVVVVAVEAVEAVEAVVAVVAVAVRIGIGRVEATEGMERDEIGGGLSRDRCG